MVEALNSDFVKQFWQFIKEGKYERKEKSRDKRRYYRFIKPENKEFPYQVELFARNPDLLDFDEESHLTPIPVDDGLSSLSAILLDEDYYRYILNNSVQEGGLHRVNTEALICLKAKAYLDIAGRIAKGGKEDKKLLRKHKGDVFRLAVMLAENNVFKLPENIQTDLQSFSNAIADDLPDKAIFKEMGLGTMDVEKVFAQFAKCFELNTTINRDENEK